MAENLEAFVAARQVPLLRLGWLLTGDWDQARDLVQEALARALPHWQRISRDGGAEPYVRRVMVNLATSWRRRNAGRAQRERLLGARREVPETATLPDGVPQRLELAAALATLPARQRASVVLRFYLDLPEAEVAALMGCSVGTVKSQTAKGLAKLRACLHQAEARPHQAAGEAR